MPHLLNDILKQQIAETKSRLRLIDDEAKPLTGSDITGVGKHQYTRLALIGYKPERGPDRFYAVFMESHWLHRALHSKLQSDEITIEFDPQWVYIEEVLHPPGQTDTVATYLKKIPNGSVVDEANETYIWLAIFEYTVSSGLAAARANAFVSKQLLIPGSNNG